MPTSDDDVEVAEGIARDMERLLETNADVDPDDVLETKLKMVRTPSGEVGIAYSATLVIPTDVFVAYRDEEIIPEVDLRKCPPRGRRHRGGSAEIGTMTYTGDGEILGHEIEDEYLVPSEQ
jgi:hypothetical protein